MTTPEVRKMPDLPPLFLGLVALVLLGNRLWFMWGASPFPDEAYYWLWGQHPALSYYDHPPLQAWMQGVFAALFGDSLFALRLPAMFSSAVLVAVILWWLRGFTPRQKLTAVLVVFASPLYFIFSAMVFNDHLMVALLALAGIPAWRALDAAARGRVAARPLYLAALLIGLAGLTKYNAALFALGLFGVALAVPRFRLLARSPHLYLAALLALAVLTPVFVWNLQHGAASFQYNLSDRMDDATPLAEKLGNMLRFLLSYGVAASPFLMSGMWRLMRGEKYGTPANWRPLAIGVFVTATLACLALSSATFVLYYWNIMALVVFLPFAAMFLRRWQLVAHLVFGMLAATAFNINSIVLPLTALGGQADAETALLFGWPETADRAAELQRANDAPLLVASNYRHGAILGFWSAEHRVEVLSPRYSQFDFWHAGAGTAGQNAVIVTTPWHPLSQEITERFGTVTPLDSLPVRRFGRDITTYRFYLGRGFRPKTPRD